jgi:transposase
MEGYIIMSNKELKKLEVIPKIIEKTYTQAKAAQILDLSIRQVKRLCKNYRREGVQGLVSKKRGKPSNRQLPQEEKERIASCIYEKYRDFGPTLAHEKLCQYDHVTMSTSTIRNIMIKNNIWQPKRAKRATIHQMRARRSCLGELIQIDGSPHKWFEERGPDCSLLAFIDDATGKLMELQFVEAETTWGYMNLTRRYLLNHGRPLAFYSDKHSIFRINRKETERKGNLTEFGRVLKQLDIDLICANTPQAKGRVERVFKTLQDRLIKEMRLKNISRIEEANTYLPSFIEDFNQRFSRQAKNSYNAHRSIETLSLDHIFTIQQTRRLTKNLILQYKNVLYQIKTTKPHYALRKQIVTIYEKQNGEIIIEHKGRPLDYVTYQEQEVQGEIISAKLLNHHIDKIKKKYKPPKNHPWRRYKKKLFHAENF